MKKLLYLIPFLCQPLFSACPDTITSGSVGFIQVTTGCIDTRRFDDKQNGNWRIVAASMTNIIGQINSLNTSTGNFIQNTSGVIRSTHIANASINGLNIANDTIASSQTKRGLGTGLLPDEIGVLQSTHLADAGINGIDIAGGTVGGTQTVRGLLGGVLSDNAGILRSTHIANAGINGISMAAGTVGGTQTVRGLNGGVLSDNTGIVQSTHVANGGLNGISIAAGTVGGTQTVRGLNGGVLPDNAGIIFSSHVATGLGSISAATAALSVPIIVQSGGSGTSTGTVINFTGAGVTVANTQSTFTVTIAGGGGGGGNNQQVNTATMTLIHPAFQGGGAVFLATSPAIAVPGKFFNDGRSTFNVTSIQAYTGTTSSGEANVSFVMSESTPSSNGNFHIISSTAEVVSSSGSLSTPIEWSTEISTSFTMWPRYSYSVLITSVPAGPSKPAENWSFKPRGWWSP